MCIRDRLPRAESIAATFRRRGLQKYYEYCRSELVAVPRHCVVGFRKMSLQAHRVIVCDLLEGYVPHIQSDKAVRPPLCATRGLQARPCTSARLRMCPSGIFENPPSKGRGARTQEGRLRHQSLLQRVCRPLYAHPDLAYSISFARPLT